MIFPVLETEKVVQIGDMTRLNAVKSFISKDEDPITKVEIKPEASEAWIEVTGSGQTDWYLDWVYLGASREIVPQVRVTTDTDQTLNGAISLLTSEDDKLFSNDQDLVAFETDILKWVPNGRASFLNVHRAAQTKILEMLDESGVVDSQGNKLTKTAVIDNTEVNAWSRDMTLQLIFQGLANAKDDIFTTKSAHYASEALKRKARAVLRLDLNGDEQVDRGEGVQSMQSVDLFRR